MAKKLKFVISAVDGFSKMLKRARRSIRSFLRFTKAGFRGLRFAGRVAFRGLAVAALGMAATLKQSFRFETWEAMFGRMLNSVSKGKQAVKDLTMLAAKTPFTIPGIIQTSRQVRVFTDNARGGIKDMILLGDAAAYVNANVEEVGFWFGNAIESGRPMGRAALRLQELGVLSGKTRNQLEDMGKLKVKPKAAMLAVFEKDLRRFEGTMEALLGTGDQLWANLTDMTIFSMKIMGDEISKFTKDKLAKLTHELDRMSFDGTFKSWGEAANEMLDGTYKKLQSIAQLAKVAFGDVKAEPGSEIEKELMAKKEAARKTLISGTIAGFKLAGMSVVKLLLKYAPLIGLSIGKAVMDGMKGKDFGFLKTEARKAAFDAGFAKQESKTVQGPFGPQTVSKTTFPKGEKAFQDFMKQEYEKLKVQHLLTLGAEDAAAATQAMASDLDKWNKMVSQVFISDPNKLTPMGLKAAKEKAKLENENARALLGMRQSYDKIDAEFNNFLPTLKQINANPTKTFLQSRGMTFKNGIGRPSLASGSAFPMSQMMGKWMKTGAGGAMLVQIVNEPMIKSE
jgi:hypothetical protein